MPSLLSSRRRGRQWITLAVATVALGSQPAQAQLLALTVIYTQPLSFGSFVAGTGGTITLTPSGGRSKTGGVVLVSQGSSFSAAQFNITGSPGATYSITLPADGTVQLSSAVHSMAINGFTSEPSGTDYLPPTGAQTLRVGARLSVGNNQAPGQYQGAFSIMVNYQ